MAINQPTKSIITLRMYVDLLRRASEGEIRSPSNLDGPEKRATEELVRSGFLSDGDKTVIDGFLIFSQPLVITPQGIAALSAWQMQLKESVWYWNAVDTLVRILWVMVGALIASMSDILKYVIT